MNDPLPVVIIDYKLGNLFSVQRACSILAIPALVSSDAEAVRQARAVILPGVGAFGQAMENLCNLRLVEPILEHVREGKELFGICLGLQLLFSESEEFGRPRGLGVIEGRVKRLPVSDAPVPQIGWNTVLPSSGDVNNWRDSPLRTIRCNSWLYFVHSFYAENGCSSDALTKTSYAGFEYTSSIRRGNVFATQFHPEKSGAVGLEIYKSWYNGIKR